MSENRPKMKTTTSILLIAILSLAGCATQKRDLYLVPPTGWVLYCQDNQADPGCADYSYLERINDYVNGIIVYEPEPIGKEIWRSLPHGGYGDCEDYAITKRALILKAGFSPERLHLATCVMPSSEAHVVLIVEIGQRWVVLDNANEKVRPFEDVPYRWLAVQFGDKWLNYQYR